MTKIGPKEAALTALRASAATKPKKRNARRAPETARKAPSRKLRPKVPVDPHLLAQSLADSALVTRAVEAYLRHRQRSKATAKASREKKVASPA